MATKKAHTHEYYQHATWETHLACGICGYAAPAVDIRALLPELVKMGPYPRLGGLVCPAQIRPYARVENGRLIDNRVG
jgi:hypothetical protein